MTEQQIIDLYKKTYSISEMLNSVPHRRNKIVKILKEAGVYEGLNGPNYLAKKVEKHRNVMREKYGVDNISQIRTNKLIESNNIEYDKFSFDENLKKYMKDVRNHSKNLVTRKKTITPPKTCFYTGLEFAEEFKNAVNPNDPLKRTVDHKHPIILCYLEGWSVEDAGGEDNLVFVLRYINSVKSNTTHECFLPIANILKERLRNEIVR